jgi:lipid A 4'-phosphatase
MNKPALFIIISSIIAVIFLLNPNIDLFVSGLFYKPDEKFFLSAFALPVYIHESVQYVTRLIAIFLVALLFLGSANKSKVYYGLTKRKLIYLLLALIIGPGLAVNVIFKDHWGRARPSTVQEFGGTKTFTPPFIISDQCEKNCSFVSGDPSVGFYIFAFAFAFPARRKLFSGVALALGGIYGTTRIVQGAHFLSDVIFSGVFTITVCYLLGLLILKKEGDS